MRLVEQLESNRAVFAAWSNIPGPEIPAALASAGFDTVVVDLQHGSHGEGEAYRSVAGINMAGKPAILRIPVGRNDMASRGLDAGFEAVIAPMINSVDEAKAFGAAMKYPPLGERSWGPSQALRLNPMIAPNDYFLKANKQTLAIAMIETRQAASVCSQILALDTIDGIFIGPSDLSISWSGGGAPNPHLPEMQDFIAEAAKLANDAGKIAAVYAFGPENSAYYADLGYRLISASGDMAVIQAGASAILGPLRK